MPRRLVTAARATRTAVLSVCVALGSASATASGLPSATAARTMSVKDEGRLRLIKSSGSKLIDEGPATGTIPGTAKIVFVYDGNPTVSAQVTIYGHGGSIEGHGKGRLSSPSSRSPSFKGTLTITGGSGRYARARGSGQMFGVFYRRSYAITVQTQGTLSY
jgi:hypothetical protein